MLNDLEAKVGLGRYAIEMFNPEKYQSFFQLIDDNREQLAVFFVGIVSKTNTLEETKRFCEQVQLRMADRSYFPFVVIDTATQKFIGLVDIKNIDWAIPKAEIGYCIDARYAGQGIMSEAVKVVTEFVARKYALKKVFCRVAPENLASVNIAIKNGFELEGTLRREYKTLHGDIVDLNYYGRLFH